MSVILKTTEGHCWQLNSQNNCGKKTTTCGQWCTAAQRNYKHQFKLCKHLQRKLEGLLAASKSSGLSRWRSATLPPHQRRQHFASSSEVTLHTLLQCWPPETVHVSIRRMCFGYCFGVKQKQAILLICLVMRHLRRHITVRGDKTPHNPT